MSSPSVSSLLAEIAQIGRDHKRGGYSRPGYGPEDHELREWFAAHANRIGLEVETDQNGIVWGWWAPTGDRTSAIVTGSHLDSVPGGGAFDGPLGVASALVAFERLRARRATGARAIAVFPEEEGSRFGLACLGSRLLTGAVNIDDVRRLKDDGGSTFADVAGRNGLDAALLGRDPTALDRIGAFVELHIEQGLDLVQRRQPVAVASSIIGHGRWRISFFGEGNHAGTTRMADRRDPMIAAAATIVEVRRLARAVDDARATVGRIQPVPGGTNVIASRVELWLDVRHPDDQITADLVNAISEGAQRLAAAEGCTARTVQESLSGTTKFDHDLQQELARALPEAPILATGAGHDAGVLASHVPSAMLFVRNPTGVSHSEFEHIEDADADAGVDALTTGRARRRTTARPGRTAP